MYLIHSFFFSFFFIALNFNKNEKFQQNFDIKMEMAISLVMQPQSVNDPGRQQIARQIILCANSYYTVYVYFTLVYSQYIYINISLFLVIRWKNSEVDCGARGLAITLFVVNNFIHNKIYTQVRDTPNDDKPHALFMVLSDILWGNHT